MKVLFFIVLALATLAFCADQEFIDTCLQAHNSERAALGIDELIWSDDLAESALKWAKNLARRNSLKSSNRKRIGENYGRKRSSEDSLELILESWTSEREDYVHKPYPKCSRTRDGDDVEHYTQMIWQDTTEVGCGFVKGFGKDYLVCHYAEAGNKRGKYAYDIETTELNVEEDPSDEVEETETKTEVTDVKTEEVVVGGKPEEIKTEIKTEEIKTDIKKTNPITGVITEEIKTETKTQEIKTETPKTPTPTPTKAPEDNSFIGKCLKAHNVERAEVNVPDLTWSEDLAESALSWAKELASRKTLKHSSGRVKTGENIAYTGTKSNSVERLLEMWTSEKKYYVHRPYPDCSSTGDKGDVGHYTQIIWNDTTKVGCGLATNSGKDYMVCQYQTSGNRKGKYAY